MNEEKQNKIYDLAEDLAEQKLCKGPRCLCPAECECSQCETFQSYRDYLAASMGVYNEKSMATLRISHWLYNREGDENYPQTFSWDYLEHINDDIEQDDASLYDAKNKAAKEFTNFIKEQNLEDGEYEAEIIISVQDARDEIYLDRDEIYLDRDEFIVIIKDKEVYFAND